jgi:phosphatidate cytidylyltransferase
VTGPAAAPPSGRFHDLRTRVVSAAVMLAVGAAEVWLGGLSFALLVVALTAVMVWELARMTAPARRATPVGLSAAAAACLAGAVFLPGEAAPVLLLVPALLLALTPRRDRRLAAALAAAMMVAGFGLVVIREELGTAAILWVILVVIASDVAGYFFGRLLGGPKFWPAISPKKTWSGTVAGWIAAALVGLGFVLAGRAPWSLVLLSPLVALAGQMGDIAESWVKRRAGVKDASTLIPGHGGLMDRFDALTGAVVAVMLLGLALPLPLPVPAGATVGVP